MSRRYRGLYQNADLAVYELVTETPGVTFQINNLKLFLQVVTLSINDNITFWENIKQRLKKKILGTNIDLK